MYQLLCCLGLLALSTGASGAKHSEWDLAVSSESRIKFYRYDSLLKGESLLFSNVTALKYVDAYNTLVFVNRNVHDNASISSYSFDTDLYRPLVNKKPNEKIEDLAFDMVTSTLFWTDSSDKSIYWMSLKPGIDNYVNLLIKLDDEIPSAIDVDSCRGYVYWTNINIDKPTIERARLDGTERKTIINTDVHNPVSLVIDQRTRRLYWADDRKGIHYSIESSDLEGNNRMKLVVGTDQVPSAITVSKYSIYWVDTVSKSIWKLPMNMNRAEPKQYKVYRNIPPSDIVANYPVREQTAFIPECKALDTLATKLIEKKSTLYIPTTCFALDQYCVHGVIDDRFEFTPWCKCDHGYTGERCEKFVCQNFCLHGDCSVTAKGHPSCRCKEGYTGDRCEINI